MLKEWNGCNSINLIFEGDKQRHAHTQKLFNLPHLYISSHLHFCTFSVRQHVRKMWRIKRPFNWGSRDIIYQTVSNLSHSPLCPTHMSTETQTPQNLKKKKDFIEPSVSIIRKKEKTMNLGRTHCAISLWGGKKWLFNCISFGQKW